MCTKTNFPLRAFTLLIAMLILLNTGGYALGEADNAEIPAENMEIAGELPVSSADDLNNAPEDSPTGAEDANLSADNVRVTEAATSTVSRQIELFLFSEDQKLVMPKNARSFWFILPQGIVPVGQCDLQLHITYSLTIIDELSALMLYVNDIPIASKKIVQEGQQDFVWNIQFDSELLNLDGYNEIKITSVQRSIEGECADIDNPLNWLVIHKESKFLMAVELTGSPFIKDYYNLFYDSISPQFVIQNDYILNDFMDADAIGSAFAMANAAGMFYPDRQKIFFNFAEQAANLETGNNAIYLETADRMGKADEALISIEGVTQEEPYYKLHVSAPTGKGLKKAGRYFGNRDLVEQTELENLLLKSAVAPKNIRTYAKMKESGLYTFTDFGYSDLTLSNVFHQQIEYTFVQPEGIRGGEGSYININFRHSEALLPERSLLTVLINGIPIDSVKLTPSNAAGGNLMVNIPAEAMQSPEIVVGVQVYHYLGPVDCTKDYYDAAWTVIDADLSKVFLADTKNVVRPTLMGFPYFRDTSALPALSLFFSDVANGQMLEIGAMLAARVGQNSGMAFEWNVLSEDLPANTDGNIVVIGRRDNLILPQDVLDQLSIIPLAEGYQIMDSSLPVIRENLNDRCIIQVIQSPWDMFKKMYIIMYDNDVSLGYLYQLLEERANLVKLNGQVALIGKNASVQTYNTQAFVSETTVPMQFTDYLKQFEAYVGMAWWMVLLILLGVLIVLNFIIRVFRNKRDEYKYTGDKHKKEQGFEAKKEEEEDGDTGK